MVSHLSNLLLLLLLALAACRGARTSAAASRCGGITGVAELHSCLLAGYDRNERPGFGAADPDDVTVQFFITSVFGVDQKQLQFRVAGYFRQWWFDHRLAYNATPDLAAGVPMDTVRGSVCQPDTYVENALKFSTGDSLLKLHPTGEVWSSERFELTATCDMDFRDLPYDVQECNVETSTYAASGHDVRLKFKTDAANNTIAAESAAGVEENPEWAITVHSGGRIVKRDFSGTPWYYAFVDFSFARREQYYVQSAVVPGILFCGISYAGYWMDRKPAPARVAVGLIPILITVNSNNEVRNNLPKISYSTWLNDRHPWPCSRVSCRHQRRRAALRWR